MTDFAKGPSVARVCDHGWASSDRCTAPALWQIVYDHEDAAACGRHLNAVMLLATESGWVKVDRVDLPGRKDRS